MQMTIALPAPIAADLIQLGRTTAVNCDVGTPNVEVLEQVINYLLFRAAEGVRRPGTSAAIWVDQAFGLPLDRDYL